jgi:hypothetical protein
LSVVELPIHTRGVRTTVEGRSYRGQGRSRSSKKAFYHERIAISFATTDVSIGEDEYRTGERPCPVRTFFLAGAHALVLFKLTVYLRRFHRPKVSQAANQEGPAAPAEVVTKPKAVPTKRKKTKKGPARLTKKKVTVQDLDEEMDAYRAAVPQIGGDPTRWLSLDETPHLSRFWFQDVSFEGLVFDAQFSDQSVPLFAGCF